MSDEKTCEQSTKTNAFAGHRLACICDTPEVQVFTMRDALQGRMMSVQLTFTPEGIAIQGDICPGHSGVCSDLGYGLQWFVGQKSGGYLCSKFLRKTWVPSIGEAALRAELAADPPDESPEALAAIRELLEHNDGLHEAEVCDAIGHIEEWWSYFRDYDPADAGWLIAIQRRFAELYAEQKP